MRVLNDLDPRKFEISLISPRNHMLFTPFLPSAAVGTLSPRSVCEPVRPHIAAKEARYYQAHAESLDTSNKTLYARCLKGQLYPVPYDRLIISVGYKANDFNIPGVKDNALFMKETADAHRFRENFLQRLEEASFHARLGNDEAKIRQLLSIVVVGGGPTGVELAAEITDFVKTDFHRLYPHLRDYITVHLVEGLPTVLAHLQEDRLKDYAIKHLSKRQGVQMHLNEFVSKATEKELHLKSGKAIPFGTLVWCAGIKPVSFLNSVDLPKTANGAQLLVDPYLRSIGHENIYALGDCAQIEGNRLPQTAQVAKQQGQYLSKQLNKPGPHRARPFKFASLGNMAYLGSQTGLIAESPVLKGLAGYLAWMGWRSAYWSMQFSMRTRLAIGTDWLTTGLCGRSIVRLGQDSSNTDPVRPQVDKPHEVPTSGLGPKPLTDQPGSVSPEVPSPELAMLRNGRNASNGLTVNQTA
eukprot:TRINITY_DN21756_c0_g1_i2.p1 TRINITY_DN21756_c0_g1~~TRINITY_DN21756_c0_g1_i2.p1  ORF type:complete len:505 (-),score=83.57 TRINITY_DN21756_c0_g1_i2:91-1494(-)